MKNIVLVGFMGVGKTTIGRRVAAKLKLNFYDTDEAISRCEKMPVYELLQKKGTKYFEGAQRFAVSTICQEENALISTGGDTVCDPENLKVLQKNSVMVWLKASPETIYKNTRFSEHKRPGLKNISLEELAAMIEERTPAYSRAHITVCVDKGSMEETCEKIIEEYTKETQK